MAQATKAIESELQAHLLSALVNPEQTRLDAWNRLREGITRVASGMSRGEDTHELEQRLQALFTWLHPMERLFVFPGEARLAALVEAARRRDVGLLEPKVRRLVGLLSQHGDRASQLDGHEPAMPGQDMPHYFTVLVADDISHEMFSRLRRGMQQAQAGERQFVYEPLHVTSLEDALVAALFNNEVQACLIRKDLPVRSRQPVEALRVALEPVLAAAEKGQEECGVVLAHWLRDMRPQLDLYLVTDESLAARELHTSRNFNRVFYLYESPHELHVTLVDGVRERYRTPFFDALRHYASRPIGNFHALPIARGHSVFNSRWLRDMGEFYGTNLFMAESSSTAGGLDSLLEPTGTIRQAQEKAARTFGAEHTFFVTNGTSTANKIVHQTLLEPGDVVLIDRNCHKSHHYGLVLAGAQPVYLDAYPCQPFAIYGGVPLRTLKQKLLELRDAGRLERVKLVVLTNCTFDGLVYHPLRVMEELLAIKPDLAFLWDEAWFAFAGFAPLPRQRTAMASAKRLSERLRGSAYREEYRAWKAKQGSAPLTLEAALEQPLLPDPDKVRIRVYATQSTHKSLSAFRQGSMIHIRDDDFERRAEEPFREAYFTHITTSPNHQLVASLDLARRQMDLEGFAMVKEAYQLALRMRERMRENPLLHRYFRMLDVDDLVPREYRASGLERYVGDGGATVASLTRAWADDEFVLDPTRLTLYTALTGNNGFQFRGRVLMGQLGIQVNHTSINTVLMNATIGVTWGSLSYLLDGLKHEARALESWLAHASGAERRLFESRVHAITDALPPLPDFSGFHEAFQPSGGVGEGDLRAAFYRAYREEDCEYVPLPEAAATLESGRTLVSTRFVVPYPPGFPILVPGQRVSAGIIEFMRKLDVKEVHGYRPELGLRVFTEKALERGTAEEGARAEAYPRGLPPQPEPRFH
ncbi:aminotransferase class I/II-fold pyridoxal phosphate-dependent enzyme [Pyxidicoccus sp. MSG2]|uniref:aminotransferase class I/II-fold pyridoxal phosphate-dependent enzyme n=1 Tax=Pyxidicoccus sp. MSG2 TaxID=2996790 RepID=UPI00227229A9|nr:aminotransferase class I/II-fold pyridoxal phosphate-dependent enzyme [Pyxidicoccus sp. MSG2]MCY1020049.1 aminotransferase class I/II-fold pyridoxal phosphate-dependent enzyme [Pyxidicoccus sp. MSG2]